MFTNEGVCAHEIQVIRNHHQITDRQLGRDSTCGVRDKQLVRSERVKHAHGKGCKGRRVPLVNMEPAAQRYYFTASECAYYDRALEAAGPARTDDLARLNAKRAAVMSAS